MTSSPGPCDLKTTRMLLGSDGSTTLLLQALVGAPLRVRVQRQGTTVPDLVDRRLHEPLRLSGTERLVLRRSRLVAPDGTVVSSNVVIFREKPIAWSGGSDDQVPLGLQLRSRQTLQRRQLLSQGRAVWPLDGRPCAYKEYVIHEEGGGPMYVHERFDPDLVGLPEAVSGPGAALPEALDAVPDGRR